MTYDGTAVRLYIDGVLIDSATGAHVSNDNPLLFGRWTPASEYWDGVVDEVRLEIFANGADPNVATPVATSDLGKPTPAANGTFP